MRHQRADVKLGRETKHRRQMLRNMVTSLFKAERMMTTVQKARFFRPHAEKLITLGKRGGLHARRQAAAFLLDPDAVRKLFDTIGPRFGSRAGGYTRMTRLGWRKGDGAELVMVELVGSELKKKAPKKKVKGEAEPAAQVAGGEDKKEDKKK